MAQGTLWIAPIQRAWANSSGTVVPGAKAYFYAAGTSTPVNVYSDVGLTTAITQPVTADSNGIFVEIFLSPGTAYKVDLQTAAGVSLTGYPADNQLAIPASSATVDVTGTAGEAISAGMAVYLSDGSGGKNAGQWYKGDSANTYSSTLPEIGMAPASISSAASGTIRIAGLVTGLTVTIGQNYYIGTAGAITTTPPTNARWIGRADTATSVIVAGNPPPTTVTSSITGLTVAQGGTGAATFTAHGVLLGEGTSAIVPTAAGTTGQLLVGATGADPAFAGAAASGASMVLLKANSGTDTSAGATTVDSIATGAMTAKDKLLIVVGATSVTQQTASLLLYSVTDAQILKSFLAGALAAAETTVEITYAMPAQTAATTYWLFSNGSSTAAGANGATSVVTGLTAWTTGFTLGLRHGGVTAGGTLQWEWAVYKLVGQ